MRSREAKKELEKAMIKLKDRAVKILSVETEDKMTERQIAAKVRSIFASYC